LPRTFSPRPRPSGSVTPRPGSPSLRVPVVNRDPAAGMARTTVRAPIRLLCLRRSDELEAGSVDASTRRAYHDGSRDPIPWSPFLRVGARTLRTEQCAKSQGVTPSISGGRVRRVCRLDGRTKLHHRKADPGVLLGEADFPTTNPKTGLHGRVQRFSTESLILAQDERWRRA